MLHNEVQGKVDRGNDIIKQNLEMYDKEFKYKEGLRKEADIKKEKEATKAENLRRYKIEQENKKLDREGKGESKTTKKVWDKTADMYVYRTDDQISKEPDRYGMNKKTAMEIKRAGAINLGDAKLKQNVKTPEFSSKATKAAKTIVGKTWDVMEPEQKKLAIKMEMDKQIRAIYGDEDVVFGRDKETGIVGWYDSNGALIRRYE